MRLLRSGQPYHWTAETRANAIRSAQLGETPAEIAKRMGRGVSAIQRVLHEARKEGVGIPYQKPGRKKHPIGHAETVRLCRELGVTGDATARLLGVSQATVWRRRRALRDEFGYDEPSMPIRPTA
jgi:predicted DNA-binding protein (UPF0251 family)